jgi:HEAT repeat protein
MDGAAFANPRRSGLALVRFLPICLAIAGCSTYIGTTSTSFLRTVRTSPDPNIRYIAYAKLGNLSAYENAYQKAEAIETLSKKYAEGLEPIAIRATIVRSLGNLGDRRARPVAVKAANDSEAIIRLEGCRALGKVGTPEDATILARIMTVDTLEDCRIAAIEGLGSLRTQDPRIIQILLDGMEHDDPAIRLECLNSLRKITKKDFGTEPAAWRQAVQQTAASPKPLGEQSVPTAPAAPNGSHGPQS